MKSKKALFLASLVLFLLSYTNNYAEKSQGLIIHREKLDFISGLNEEELKKTMDPAKYVGRAPIQVDKFIANVVKPILDANKEELGVKAEINV